MEEQNSIWSPDANNAGAGQSSPKSLPDFQRMFPNEEACRTGGGTDLYGVVQGDVGTPGRVGQMNQSSILGNNRIGME